MRPQRYGDRGSRSFASALLCAVLASGCTSSDTPDDFRPSDSSTLVTSSASSTIGQAVLPPGVLLVRELTCADVGIASVPPDPLDVEAAGLSFSGTHAMKDAVPGGELPVDAGSQSLLFTKIFLYVSTRAAMQTTVTVVEPANVLLAYFGADGWSRRPTDEAMLTAASRSMTVASCPDRTLPGYFGGLLAPGPTCVVLEVAPSGGSAKTVTFPTTGAVC